jgi:hypothetical protein
VEPIVGPGGRYRARLELLQQAGNETYLRRRTSEGRRQGAEWLVLLGEEGTARLTLGEGGITLHTLGLAQPGRAILQAEVEAGPGAPDWLPANATVRLFEGDRQAAAAVRDRFVPLPGATKPADVEAPGELPLDQLFIAVGRSVARANRALVEIESPGGTALVTTVTVNVALDALAVERGRAVVKPVGGSSPAPPVSVGTNRGAQHAVSWPYFCQPQSGASGVQGASAQGSGGSPAGYVQFTMALAPGAPSEGTAPLASPSVSASGATSSQPLVALPTRRK